MVFLFFLLHSLLVYFICGNATYVIVQPPVCPYLFSFLPLTPIAFEYIEHFQPQLTGRNLKNGFTEFYEGKDIAVRAPSDFNTQSLTVFAPAQAAGLVPWKSV